MSTKGFSLVEVLITLLVFTIVGLAILMCINYSVKNVIASRNAEIAINLCQEEIEAIKTFPYESIPCPATFTPTWYQKGKEIFNGYPTGNFPPVLYPATDTTCNYLGDPVSDPAMCTVTKPPHDHKDLLVSIGVGTQTTNGTKTIITQWVVDEEAVPEISNYKRIKVIIEWREGGLSKRTREISTYISKK